jgi:HK97 family phage portal protein
MPLLASGRRLPLAPQGLAELEPISEEGRYYAERVGMELEYRFALYGEIWERQPWVHTVIEKRANAIARLPVNCWDVNGSTRSLDTRSQYATLLSDPCPKMDPFHFWFWVQSTIDIYGETYLAIQRDEQGAPEALWPMHPSRVAIKRDSPSGEYIYYFQAGQGIGTELVAFSEADVVPFRLFNPNGMERGFSRMEALKQTIFAEDSSRNAVSSMWKNAGRPNLVLESSNRLGKAGRDRLKLAFDQAHAGTANAGSTLVLEDGVTAKAVQITAVDLELIEARRLNREEIAAVYDVAPTLIGILDHATFSNVTEQMRGFYRDTMAPVIESIQSVMDKYVGSHWPRKNIMRFAVDEVIRGDYEVRVEAAHKGIATGVMTPNEARDLIGLNRYEDPKADELFANSAIQRLGEPAEQIRLMGTETGTTPDGVMLAPMPVASLNAAPPTSIPKPLTGTSKPVGIPSSKPPAPTGQAPSVNTPSSNRHLRSIKGEMGRGKTDDEIIAFAYKLYTDHKDDLDDIMTAVQLAIDERNRKATTK